MISWVRAVGQQPVPTHVEHGAGPNERRHSLSRGHKI
jgi:hypothetical protein